MCEYELNLTKYEAAMFKSYLIDFDREHVGVTVNIFQYGALVSRSVVNVKQLNVPRYVSTFTNQCRARD